MISSLEDELQDLLTDLTRKYKKSIEMENSSIDNELDKNFYNGKREAYYYSLKKVEKLLIWFDIIDSRNNFL